MKICVSMVSAAALLAIVLSLSVAPNSYASRRDDSGPGGDVRDRIVRFINDIRHFFGANNADELVGPRP